METLVILVYLILLPAAAGYEVADCVERYCEQHEIFKNRR